MPGASSLGEMPYRILGRTGERVSAIFDEEGAHAALIDARQAGTLRYIGFSGHKDPRIHLHMLEVVDEAEKPARVQQLMSE
jgi:predicted aldo/keto reductase-like oxidoreductase